MSSSVPETVLESCVIYTGKRITLKKTKIRTSNGVESDRDIIEHPGVVVIAPMVNDSTILMIRQFRTAVQRWLLEVPAGVIESGEDLVFAAQRELREEVGYRSEDIRSVFAAFPTPGFCNEFMHFFIAKSLVKDPLPPDLDEDISVVPVSISDAIALISRGEIVDLKSIALIMYLKSIQSS